MAAAIECAARALATSTASTRAIVIFTDGQPNDCEGTIRAAKRVAATGIDIVAIGTDDADRGLLAAIASRPDLAVPVDRQDIAHGFRQAALLLGAGQGHQGDR